MKKFVIVFMMVVNATNAYAQYFAPVYIPPPVPIPRWWQQGAIPVRERPEYAPLPPPPQEQVPVPVPEPVIVEKPVVIEKRIPVAVPVPTRRPVCTTYPDPWDTFGYIFGDPFMITTCY
jgi:hypothetical protein